MATVLPEIDVEKVKRYCLAKIPERLHNEVRIATSIRGKSISIHECRPIWRGRPGSGPRRRRPAPLRGRRNLDALLRDRNSKWFLYFDLDSHQPVDVILKEIEADPTGIFWG